MLSKNLRSTANRVSKTFLGKRSYGSFDREFYHMANAMARDFERSVRRRSRPWDSFGRNSWFSEPVVFEPVFYEPVRPTYEKRTIVNDEDGRLIVKTQRKSPGKPWETFFEEYVNEKNLQQGKKPEALGQGQKSTTNEQTAKDQSATQQENRKENQNTSATKQQQQQQRQTIERDNSEKERATEAPAENQTASRKNANQPKTNTQQEQDSANDVLSLFDRQFQEMSEGFARDFDTFFGTRSAFNVFGNQRWFEPEFDQSYTTYRMKTVVNNNGNVTVKTVTKDPGSAWKTSVEHYNRDGALEGSKKTESISDASSEQKVNEKAEETAKNDQQTGKDQASSQ